MFQKHVQNGAIHVTEPELIRDIENILFYILEMIDKDESKCAIFIQSELCSVVECDISECIDLFCRIVEHLVSICEDANTLQNLYDIIIEKVLTCMTTSRVEQVRNRCAKLVLDTTPKLSKETTFVIFTSLTNNRIHHRFFALLNLIYL